MKLLDASVLPDAFEYPPELLRMIDLDLTDMDPWTVLTGDALRLRKDGLTERFPARLLIPFARREDNDDVACFEMVESRQLVVRIHDFASPGWERRVEYPSFRAWFHEAVEDMFDFE